MTDGDVTRWLDRLSTGDADALDRVVGLLYDELRALARRNLSSERSDHTLAPTALVNEVYLRLTSQRRIDAGSRTRFLGVAATTMRRVLVDYARARMRVKRGGGQVPLSLGEAGHVMSEAQSEEVIALDEALDRLSALDERAARVVEYRFFAGLSSEETAAVLGVSTKTVQRDWISARAWLRKEVDRDLDA